MVTHDRIEWQILAQLQGLIWSLASLTAGLLKGVPASMPENDAENRSRNGPELEPRAYSSFI